MKPWHDDPRALQSSAVEMARTAGRIEEHLQRVPCSHERFRAEQERAAARHMGEAWGALFRLAEIAYDARRGVL